MIEYFTPDYAGRPFSLFGTSHLLTLAVLAVLGIAVIYAAQKSPVKKRSQIRSALVALVLVNELSWHVWNLAWGTWGLENMLPLHMCSAMIWISIFVLLVQYRPLYPLVYFLGVAGAAQALITPDAGMFGFPHFRYFQTMIAHGGLVMLGLWVVLVEKCRPDFRSLVRVLIGLNVYAVIVWFVNAAVGSNYLYVTGKPETASIIDFFPEWPWYLAILEVLAGVFLLLLYLPFRPSGGRARLQPAEIAHMDRGMDL